MSAALKAVKKHRQRTKRQHPGTQFEFTPLEAAKLIKSGLAFTAIGRFHKASGFSLGQIKRLAHLSEGTLARRRRTGRLSQSESERLNLVQTLRLPPQQIRIVEFILRNHCDKQIAAALHIKVPTLRTYIERIYARLGVRDRLGLALHLLAMSHGIYPVEQ